jgi:7,8-dihydroneopterin aldolase/epimerase/oxygenase
MGKVVLKNMMFYGYHGVYEHEREMGQRFFVDVELVLDFTKAVASDALEDTLNYVAVYDEIKMVMETHKFRLLEALAGRIADTLLTGRVTTVTVRVRKPSVPLPAPLDYVEVELTRSRAL